MQKLIAYMNGELVGTLEKHKNGAHTFQYDKNWITNVASRPLSLSLKLQLPTITSDAVINFFDNLYYLIDNILDAHQPKLVTTWLFQSLQSHLPHTLSLLHYGIRASINTPSVSAP